MSFISRLVVRLSLLRVHLPLVVSVVAIIVVNCVAVRPCSAQDAGSALSGFSSSELFDITDGRQLKPNDVAIKRMLFRVAQTSRSSLKKFARMTSAVEFEQLVEQPRDFRCHVFSISGIAKSVQRYESSDENLDESERGRYLVHVKLDQGKDCLVVLPGDSTNENAVPQSWKLNESIEEPIRFEGFFLAVYDFLDSTDDVDDTATQSLIVPKLAQTDVPVFVSPRIQWFPIASDDQSLSHAVLLLASNGVDIGEFDRLRRKVNGRMRSEDSLPFYQMLTAANSLDRSQFPTEGLVDFATCLQSASSCVGQPMQLRGTVRKITEVEVSDRELQTEFGIQRYYQLHMFVPLDQQEIVITSADGKQKMHLNNRFPVTICCLELPTDQAAMEGKLVSVDGFFFKIWNYESELSRSKSVQLNQISPLLIALKPALVDMGGEAFNWSIGIAGLVALLGAVSLIWFYGPGDKRKPAFKREKPTVQIEIRDD